MKHLVSIALLGGLLLNLGGVLDPPPLPAPTATTAETDPPPPNPWGDVTLEAGNLPVILLAPHGGNVRPEGVPRRTDGPKRDYAADLLASEVARALSWIGVDGTVHRPHLITMALHRSCADANRALDDPPWATENEAGEAIEAHPRAVRAWEDFHAYAGWAVARVQAEHGKGLLLDLHGLAASRTADHYGYRLRRDDLHDEERADGMSSDEALAARVREASTMRALARTKATDAEIASLIRGVDSLATMVDVAGAELFPEITDEEGEPRGRPAKPSARIPDPWGPGVPESDRTYFNGRYDIQAHSSWNEGVLVDAIQIETTRDARHDEAGRRRFARALALALRRFFTRHHQMRIEAPIAAAGK